MFDATNPSAYTRRRFLVSGLTLASAAVAVPSFLQRSALALPQAAPDTTSIPGVPEERILVVVQLSGGNDGLNTVVPFSQNAYYKARAAIAIPAEKVIKLGSDDVGLHPAMRGFGELYDDGLLSVVQGVGYPNPNRSHFKSMDIWHTADTTATGDGWLGRYFDSECCGFGKGESGTREASAKPKAPVQPGIAIGREAPLAMRGRQVQPISFESADLFRWTGTNEDKALASYYDKLTRVSGEQAAAELDAGADHNSSFLSRTALDAQVNSDLIRKAVATKPKATYPGGNPLAGQLQMVASMIHAKLRTRVYYVNLGGFDTHAGQGGENGRHAQLVGQFSSALRAFYNDLKAQGNDARVLTMVFSEFGRRVGQNASGGTDHGTAAPLFLVGPIVKPGVANPHPSMTDLDQGDLKYTVDFREVYSAVIGGWMKADARAILEGAFSPAPVLKNT
jgi:uncharacterized protein (DUF1501 family)